MSFGPRSEEEAELAQRLILILVRRLNKTSGQIFNVGANNQISIIGLADRIKQMTGSNSPIVHVPFDEVYGTGIEDMLHRVPCADKVRDTIGWIPKNTLDDILAAVIASAGVPELRSA